MFELRQAPASPREQPLRLLLEEDEQRRGERLECERERGAREHEPRVLDVPAPPARPSTMPAAASPPAKASRPEAQSGTAIPNAATAVTAR